MKNSKYRWVLIAVLVVIAIYQVMNEEAPADVVAPAPATVEQVEIVEEVAEDVAVEEPAVVVEEVEPTVMPVAVDKFAGLEEATGDFDFYVMALSWSPDYCASNNAPQQCSVGKQLDFVLHGLWPPYDRGYPSYCSDESMAYDLRDDFVGLYPSEKLYDHEWEKHGTCTGLSAEGYLLWSEALKNSLEIPTAYDSPAEPFRTNADELSEAFIVENPDFLADSFAVYCSDSGRFLKEIFVCFEIDGEPRACSGELLKSASKSCGQESFLVRNTR